MLRLALPVILAEVGWVAMGVVDTIMVGPLGPAAIAASGVANALLTGFAIFGMGTLLGLDTLVSQAYGAGRTLECRRWLVHGVALAVMLAIPLLLVCVAVHAAIPSLGFHADVGPLLDDYFGVLLWSAPWLLLYAAFRRYLQGVHFVTPVMFALVSANIVNAVANWLLIYGHAGFPALGVTGSAWATFIARLYMMLVLLAAVIRHDRWRVADLRALGPLERGAMMQLLRLGLPAAATVALEVGVFAAGSTLAGQLEPISAASHQIAMNIAALTFMVPLGLASAGAVRVGHAIGAARPQQAAAAGWTAILFGLLFMSVSATAFLVAPRWLIGLFSTDAAVLTLGTSLLFVAAIFQLFDGLQGVATGVLRGAGDTHTPMLANVAHWVLGLPLGYTLCFGVGIGVIGLWIGFSVGLFTTGLVLLYVWHRRMQALQI